MSITDAVLWIDHPPMMFERVCGMGVLERQLFILARAGIRRVWVAAARPPEADGLRLPERLEVRWVPRDGDGPVECRPPYLSYSGDHFVRHEALLDILSQTHSRHVSFRDGDRRSVIQILPFRGERVVQFDKRSMPSDSCVRVTPRGRGAVVAWLLEGARKGHDGAMARLFDRYLSLAITRHLLDTRIKPNHMTLFSSLVGLAGALELAHADHDHVVVGAVLVWLHSVLDGCDGELARLRYQESRFGGVLDFWGDNIVHVALFISLGIGVFQGTHETWALLLGFIAAAACAASAILTFRISTVGRKAESSPLFNGLALATPPPGPARLLQRVEDILAQRDFIYLLVLAALFHQRQVFLIAGAVGAPVFFLILLYLTQQSGARDALASTKAAPAPAVLAHSRGQTS